MPVTTAGLKPRYLRVQMGAGAADTHKRTRAGWWRGGGLGRHECSPSLWLKPKVAQPSAPSRRGGDAGGAKIPGISAPPLSPDPSL